MWESSNFGPETTAVRKNEELRDEQSVQNVGFECEEIMKYCLLALSLLFANVSAMAADFNCRLIRHPNIALKVQKSDVRGLIATFFDPQFQPNPQVRAVTIDELHDVASTSVEDGFYLSGTTSTDLFFKKGKKVSLKINEETLKGKLRVGLRRIRVVCKWND